MAVGYSRGIDVLSFMMNGLPEKSRIMINSVVLQLQRGHHFGGNYKSLTDLILRIRHQLHRLNKTNLEFS